MKASLLMTATLLCSVSAMAQTVSNGNTVFGTPLLIVPPSQLNLSNQGTYISWNALTGGYGETDLINNRGQGPGGFGFFNAAVPGNALGSPIAFMSSNGNFKVGASGQFGNLNGNLTIGSSADQSLGSYRINFSGFRDVNANPEYYDASIYTLRKPAPGYTNEVILSDLIFGTKSDWGNTSSDPTASVAERMRITSDGNVGIGTTAPGATLEVNGSGIKLTAGSGASIAFPDNTVQGTAWNGVLSGGDYAESVNVSGAREQYEPGDVLVIDPASEGNFLKSSTPYATAVTGIFSTKPGVVGRRQLTARAHMKEEVPMAMTGIVPTKVSAENGPIKPGDLLVSSSKPGYAMKGTDPTQMLGAVIGKAIGHLDSGVGLIEAVVTLQ
jgi:hypothetical protein